jgi:hypothetical protein
MTWGEDYWERNHKKETFNDESYERVIEAHFGILNRLQIVAPYIEQHLQQLHELDHERAQTLFHNVVEWPKPTSWWRKDDVYISSRSIMTRYNMTSVWHQWFTFYTKAKERKSQHQNSGVRVDVLDNEGNLNTYYGYIDDIEELTYELSLRIPIFKCQWVKHPQDVELDEYDFTLVDLNNVGHKDDPWILTEHVTQVFYVVEPQHEKTHVPWKTKNHQSWLRH